MFLDTIGDAHPHGLLSVGDVVAKSSNVGTAKIALELPAHTLWDLYTAAGFGQAPQLGFPGAVTGRLRPAKSWRPIEQATISYGHGVSVTLMQLARAYTAFARDGDVVPLTLLKQDVPPAGVRVMSHETTMAMRRMLEMAVGPDGTAPGAEFRSTQSLPRSIGRCEEPPAAEPREPEKFQPPYRIRTIRLFTLLSA